MPRLVLMCSALSSPEHLHSNNIISRNGAVCVSWGWAGWRKENVGEMNWVWLTDVGFLGRPGTGWERGRGCMSGASIGIIVPRVQAWIQTPDRYKFTGIDGNCEECRRSNPHLHHHLSIYPPHNSPPDRHQQELMHINREGPISVATHCKGKQGTHIFQQGRCHTPLIWDLSCIFSQSWSR